MAEPRKPSIDLGGIPKEMTKSMSSVKQSIEMLTGARGGELDGLPRDATMQDVIRLVNNIVARLNASGKSHV